MLSDESREVVTAYDVLKEGESRRAERSTVVIRRDGRIVHAYHRVKAPGHAATVLADLQADAGAS